MPKAGDGFKLTDKVREEIIKLIDERVRLHYVTRQDFNELKEVVKELAEAQKRTEERLAEFEQRTEENFNRVWEAIGQLAEAQRKTEERLNQLAQRVDQLAEAQRKTEERLNQLTQRVDQLAESLELFKKTTEENFNRVWRAIEELAIQMKNLRVEFGGFTNTLSYAFENEAFRMLPGVLERKYGIRIKERFIRADVGGREVNILGEGEVDGRSVLIVGEAKMKLEGKLERLKKERGEMDVFDELELKVLSVLREYGEREIIKVFVTHFADKEFLNMAQEKGILVIQSFEW